MEKENEMMKGEMTRRELSSLPLSSPSETDQGSLNAPKSQSATDAMGTELEERDEWWQAEEMEELPTFPDWVYESLPDLLKRVMTEARLEVNRRRQRDVVLMGALTTLSATFFNLSGKYHDKRHWPNLYFYLVAPFAAGKNTLLEPCRELVTAFSNDTEATPIADSFVLSGNITGPAMLEWLQGNEGIGLIFSTEADMLTQSLKGEYAGAMSAILRDAFGNSRVDHARRKNNKERLIIETPRLSMLLAGTQKSVSRLFSYAEVEDGLFSRFVFYCMPGEAKVDPNILRNTKGASKEERFRTLGEQYLQYWKVGLSGETSIDMQDWHKDDFPARLQQLTDKAVTRMGDDFGTGLTFRYGFICWRIAVALSAVRQASNPSRCIVVTDEDYRSAWTISRVLWCHTIFVLRSYTAGDVANSRQRPEGILSLMRDTFTTDDWFSYTTKANIPKRTAQRHLQRLHEQGAIKRTDRGQYTKNQSS